MNLSSVILVDVADTISRAFMVDILKKQTIIDLSVRMHGDMPKIKGLNSSNKSTDVRVRDMHWVRMANH